MGDAFPDEFMYTSYRRYGRYCSRRRNWNDEDPPYRRYLKDPKNLQELEALATKQVKLMEKHGTKTVDSFSMVMELLRQQHNMNFVVVCGKCLGPHRFDYDELTAPER